MLGSSSSLPLLVSKGGGLVCEAVSKADLLIHFDGKQSMKAVDLLLISLAIHLLVLPPLPSGRVRSGASC